MMSVLAREGLRVLAIGAHPDDLEVGVGGLLARLKASGATVTMAVCAIPSQAETRRAEAEAGAAALGVALEILADKPGRVEDVAMHELVRRLDEMVARCQPEIVITHAAEDLHWDHGLVHRATVSALRRTPCDLLAYKSSPEMNAQVRSFGNFFADISPHIDTKLTAIRAHASQARHVDAESSRDLARAMGRLSGFEYAETLEVLRLRV